MDADSIREYARRYRELVAADKLRHWASQYERLGPVATWEAGQRLRDHMRIVQPDWPSARDRAADLADHIELKRKLDRTAGAIRPSSAKETGSGERPE